MMYELFNPPSGTYLCTASNEAGEVTEKIELNVMCE